MLYEVLPMAVAVDIIIAVAIIPTSDEDSVIEVANLQPDKFPARSFIVPKEGHIEIDDTKHEWTNYFKSGMRGALELLRKKGWNDKPAGMKVLVHGTVPSCAGLSS